MPIASFVEQLLFTLYSLLRYLEAGLLQQQEGESSTVRDGKEPDLLRCIANFNQS